MNIYKNRSMAFWSLLLGDLIIVTIISLSAHVVMLQGFGVPFPDRTGVSWWASFFNVALAAFALSTFYNLARPQFPDRPVWAHWLILAALFGALKELLRGGLMNGVVTTGWVFSLALLIAPVIYSLTFAGLVVFVNPRLRGFWVRLVYSLGVAAVMTFVVKPLSGLALSPIIQSISGFRHADVYPFPYGWHVLIWAYVTYLEPVIACFFAAALALPGLSPRPAMRVSQFTVLILLIKGALLPTLLFGFFNGLGLWIGVLSESQFLLEGLLLALPVALILPLAFRTRLEPASLATI